MLEFRGEYRSGGACRLSWPRDKVEVAWVGRQGVGETRHHWFRIRDADQLHFVAPVSRSGEASDKRVVNRVMQNLARWARQREVADLGKTPLGLAIMAISTMLTILAGIAGVVIAGNRLADIEGPVAIASDAEGYAYVALNRTLFRLDPEGYVTDAAPMRRLGLKGYVTDMAWRDGELYIGQLETGQIHRCDLASYECGDGILRGGPDERPLRTFKFVLAPDGERIHLADTARHRVVAYDDRGNVSNVMAQTDMQLCYPNGLAWGQDGTLLVADTNRHRVAALVPDAGSERVAWNLPVVQSMPSFSVCGNRSEMVDDPLASLVVNYQSVGSGQALDVAGASRTWPVEVAVDGSGHLWVVSAGPDLKNGVVLRFADRHSAPGAVRLPKDADPFALVPAAGDMLVTDLDGFRVWRIGEDLSASPYGRGGFRATLQRLRSKQGQAEQARLGSIGLIVFAMPLLLLTLVGYAVMQRRRLFSATSSSS